MKKTLILVTLFCCTHKYAHAQNLTDLSLPSQPNSVFNASLAGDMCASLFGQPTDVAHAGLLAYKETNDRNGDEYQEGVSFDMPLKHKVTDNHYFGIGGFYYYDRSLSYDNRRQLFGLSAAYHHKLSKNGKLQLSEGLQIMGVHQNIYEEWVSFAWSDFAGKVKSTYGFINASVTLSILLKSAIIYTGISSPAPPLVTDNSNNVIDFWIPNPIFYVMSNTKLNNRITFFPKVSVDAISLLSPEEGSINYYLGADVAYKITHKTKHKNISIYAGANLNNNPWYGQKYRCYTYDIGFEMPCGFQIGLSKGLMYDDYSNYTKTYQFNLKYNQHRMIPDNVLITPKF